jgi:nicotinamide-nucleotide amidase
MLAAAITDVPGSSMCFDRSYVTYSNKAKRDMLGISDSCLEKWGAVSAKVAALMAEGAMERSGADIACSITGVAGPGPDPDGNPEGLVFVACSMPGLETAVKECRLPGGRRAVREAAVESAINLAIERLKEASSR